MVRMQNGHRETPLMSRQSTMNMDQTSVMNNESSTSETNINNRRYQQPGTQREQVNTDGNVWYPPETYQQDDAGDYRERSIYEHAEGSRIRSRVQSERRENRCLQSTGTSNYIKLPPYTGKERWEIWRNRFLEVARLRKWNDEQKLIE